MISLERLRRWARDHGIRQRLAERHYLHSWVHWGLTTTTDTTRCVRVAESALSYWLSPAAAIQTPHITVQIPTATPVSVLIAALNRVQRTAGIEYTGTHAAERAADDGFATETAAQAGPFVVQFPSLAGGVQRTVITIAEPASSFGQSVAQTDHLLDGPAVETSVTHPTALATALLTRSVRRPRARAYYLLYQLSQAATPPINWETVLRRTAQQCNLRPARVFETAFSTANRNHVETQWEQRLPTIVSSPPAFDPVWMSLQETLRDSV